jgi:hypothetical protein
MTETSDAGLVARDAFRPAYGCFHGEEKRRAGDPAVNGHGSAASYPGHFYGLEFMPYVGLGIALAECRPGSGSGNRLDDAVRAVTVPPPVDLGLRYPDLSVGGALNALSCLFSCWQVKDSFPGAPSADCPALEGLCDYLQLVPLLPVVNLPSSWDHWVWAEHLGLLLSRLAQGDIDVRALRPPAEWFPPTTSMPYCRDRGRGDVTPGDIEAFCVVFPEIAGVLTAEIPWAVRRSRRSAPADAANALASRLLGIRVDLRVGSLVSANCIDEACCYAGGEVHHLNGESLVDRLRAFLARRLPTVKARGICRRVDSLRGAAWSCTVDDLLNLDEARIERDKAGKHPEKKYPRAPRPA